MRRILLFTLLASLQYQLVFSQDFSYGIHAGLNIGGLRSGNAYQVYNYGSKWGYEAGGDIHYRLPQGISLSTGLSIMQTGGKFSAMSNYFSGLDSSTEFPEINIGRISMEVPLKIGYLINIGRHLSVMPNAGLYGSFAIASSKSDVVTSSDLKKEKWNSLKPFDKDFHHLDGMKRLNYGIVAGLDMLMSEHYVLSFQYCRGLSSLSSQYGLKTHNLSVSVGYRW